MEKTASLNLRIFASRKQQAVEILQELVFPMATAIDMYLRQIALTGSIPFPLTLPKAPASINADSMTIEQLRAELLAGFEDMQNGRVQNASSAFERFRETHS